MQARTRKNNDHSQKENGHRHLHDYTQHTFHHERKVASLIPSKNISVELLRRFSDEDSSSAWDNVCLLTALPAVRYHLR